MPARLGSKRFSGPIRAAVVVGFGLVKRWKGGFHELRSSFATFRYSSGSVTATAL